MMYMLLHRGEVKKKKKFVGRHGSSYSLNFKKKKKKKKIPALSSHKINFVEYVACVHF